MSKHSVENTRRQYNDFVANETIEDYALRYAPASFRKWSPLLLANTALGSISFLALEAIGATLLLGFGYTNAVWAILLVSVIIFAAGLPISYYCARYNIDIDLLTRSAGFGYVGSTITSLIYASFCFIFFALEAAIMAQALKLYFELPLYLGYIFCSLIIIPIVFYGITAINKLHLWTQLLWLVLMLSPLYFLITHEPQTLEKLTHFQGTISGSNEFDWYYFGIAAGISFSLIAQIGEQVDYLRFMPDKHNENRISWWFSMLTAGPGWIFLGCFKQLIGVFFASIVVLNGLAYAQAKEPVQMYYIAYTYLFENPSIALLVSTIFVLTSQIKINVTNAYAGSLAWSNFFSRITHSHPGRVVWLVFNIGIALLLMEMGVFDALQKVLGLYSNFAIAWIAVVVADLAINKPLGLSPPLVEFKRAHLYDYNPVGFVSMSVAALISTLAFTGIFGLYAQAYSWLIALVTAFLLAPVIAKITKGKYYIARKNARFAESNDLKLCTVCQRHYAETDFAHCHFYDAPICSLCCTLDMNCKDACKPKQSSFSLHAVFYVLDKLFKNRLTEQTRLRIARFFITSSLMIMIVALIFWLSYSLSIEQFDVQNLDKFAEKLTDLFFVLVVLIYVFSWWIVLGHESQTLAETELEEQNKRLDLEISERKAALVALEKAQQSLVQTEKMAALGGLVAGIAHEINTPVGVILMSATHLGAETQRFSQRYEDGEMSGTDLENFFGITKQAAQLMTINSQRAADLIQSFKQVAVDQTSGEKRVFNLKHYIDEILLSLHPQLKKTQLHVEVDCPEDLQLNSHAGALSQVLTNLIFNSICHAYLPPQSGTLRIHVNLLPNDFIELIYSDDGCGIPDELQAQVFDPFFTTQRGQGGSGLGLHIVYNIIHQTLKGELKMHSVLNEGTTFTLCFPRISTN